MFGAEWRVEVPALRGNESCDIRHLESVGEGLKGGYYDALMLMRNLKAWNEEQWPHAVDAEILC